MEQTFNASTIIYVGRSRKDEIEECKLEDFIKRWGFEVTDIGVKRDTDTLYFNHLPVTSNMWAFAYLKAVEKLFAKTGEAYASFDKAEVEEWVKYKRKYIIRHNIDAHGVLMERLQNLTSTDRRDEINKVARKEFKKLSKSTKALELAEQLLELMPATEASTLLSKIERIQYERDEIISGLDEMFKPAAADF